MAHYSWLLTAGYSPHAALKLVGDHHRLVTRQRTAVLRCACSDASLRRRRQGQVTATAVAGRPLFIDGYNVLITVEAALGGGVLLLARDGCLRDMASMHGSYRKVAQTAPALTLIGQLLAHLGTGAIHWYLDSPVSNSGRLKGVMAEVAEAHGWPWEVELVQNPDKLLMEATNPVATADSVVLDACTQWFNLAQSVVERLQPAPTLVDLSKEAE